MRKLCFASVIPVRSWDNFGLTTRYKKKYLKSQVQPILRLRELKKKFNRRLRNMPSNENSTHLLEAAQTADQVAANVLQLTFPSNPYQSDFRTTTTSSVQGSHGTELPIVEDNMIGDQTALSFQPSQPGSIRSRERISNTRRIDESGKVGARLPPRQGVENQVTARGGAETSNESTSDEGINWFPGVPFLVTSYNFPSMPTIIPVSMSLQQHGTAQANTIPISFSLPVFNPVLNLIPSAGVAAAISSHSNPNAEANVPVLNLMRWHSVPVSTPSYPTIPNTNAAPRAEEINMYQEPDDFSMHTSFTSSDPPSFTISPPTILKFLSIYVCPSIHRSILRRVARIHARRSLTQASLWDRENRCSCRRLRESRGCRPLPSRCRLR